MAVWKNGAFPLTLALLTSMSTQAFGIERSRLFVGLNIPRLFTKSADPSAGLPGLIENSTVRDDEMAAEALGQTTERWRRWLSHPRSASERVFTVGEHLYRRVFDPDVSPTQLRSSVYYPSLPPETARRAIDAMMYRVRAETLGVTLDGMRAIDEARRGNLMKELEHVIDLPRYLAAGPRVDHAILNLEALAPTPLRNIFLKELKEMRKQLTAVDIRRHELEDGVKHTGLLRGTTSADDERAAETLGLSPEEFTALIVGNAGVVPPASWTAVDRGRGVRAARALTDWALRKEQPLSVWTRYDFYPGFAAIDDLELQREIRQRVMAAAGLRIHSLTDKPLGAFPLLSGRLQYYEGVGPAHLDADSAQIEAILLRTLARLDRLTPSFLRTQVEEAVYEVRSRFTATLTRWGDLSYLTGSEVIDATEALTLKMDQAFVDGVLGLDDPNLKPYLVRMHQNGLLRVNPDFDTVRVPRHLRTDQLKRGFVAFSAFIESYLSDDAVMEMQSRRTDGQTSPMARERLAQLRADFLSAVKSDCAVLLAGPAPEPELDEPLEPGSPRPRLRRHIE